MTTEPDFYELLQVHPKADAEAIAAAYERLRARYDPAKLAGAADDLIALAKTRRTQIDAAYATLRDPQKRATYDARQARTVVARPAAVAADNTPDEDVLDYRPLPAAGGRERGAGFDAQPSGRRVARQTGRIAPATSNRPPWFLPIVAGTLIIALVGGGALLITGGGGNAATISAPPTSPPAATQTVFEQFDAQIEPARQATEANPKDAQAWINYGTAAYDSLAVIRQNLGVDSPEYTQRIPRLAEAVTAYGRALELEPNNWLVRSYLGQTLCYQGSATKDQSLITRGITEARRAYDQAPRTSQTVQTNLGLAECLVLQQPPQTEEALKLWQQIIEIDPTSPFAPNARQQIAKFQK